MSYPYVDDEPSVHFSPAELIERQVAEWRGLRTEMVAVTQREPFDYPANCRHISASPANIPERRCAQWKLRNTA